MAGENVRVNAQRDGRRLFGERIFLATVDSTSGGLIKIRRQGQASADDQFYPAAAGLAASVSPGDTVLCVVASGRPVVLVEVATT